MGGSTYPGNALTGSHPFCREFFDRFVGLTEVAQGHAAKNVVRFRELDAFIANDFDPIAPGIVKVEKAL